MPFVTMQYNAMIYVYKELLECELHVCLYFENCDNKSTKAKTCPIL